MAKTLINFQQMRAERSIDAPTVIDMDGVEHPRGPFPMDFFLEVMELEASFGKVRDSSEMIELLQRVKRLLQEILPTFPVGRLDFEESQMLIEALVRSTQPDSAVIAEAPRDSETGE